MKEPPMTTMILAEQRPLAATPLSRWTRDRFDTQLPASWQDQAIAAYRRTAPVTLDADLSTRVEALTGRTVAAPAVYVDPAARLAQVVVDGVFFRWQAGSLVVLRRCTGCGVELLTSPAILDQADLGYALAVWEPACRHCPPADRADQSEW
jgi:hypothetical protein